jgi:hypothetical protein
VEQRLELGETSLLLQFALQRRDLQVAAVAGILENLVVEDGRHLGERRPRNLLAGEIEHDDGRGETCRHCRQQGLRGGLVEPILQMPQEGVAIDLHTLVEGEAEIFRERTLA